VEPSPGISLGGLAETALTGHLHHRHCASTKQRPFPHRRLCCPLGSIGTTAASDAHPARRPLPRVTGYRARCSNNIIRRLLGRGGGPPQFPPSLSERSEPHTPGSPSAPATPGLQRLPWPSPCIRGLGTPYTPPSRVGPLTTPQASLDATDRSVAPPSRAFDAGLRPDPFPDQAASLLPGLLAATRTGLTPASDDELTTKITYTRSPPVCWAHE
jgi:hypothetical protein